VKLVSFGEAFFILLAERGVMPKEGLWMVALFFGYGKPIGFAAESAAQLR
jgi:hypothetical protein